MPAVAAAICYNKYCSRGIARGRCHRANYNPEDVIECNNNALEACALKIPNGTWGWEQPIIDGSIASSATI